MKALVIGFAAASLLMAALPQSALAQAPAAAPAAQVHADVGAVRVGKTTVPADSSVGANAGDTILVSNGRATITFTNGCSVAVTGRYRIPAVAPVCTLVPADVASASSAHGVAIALGGLALLGAAAGAGGGGGSDHASSP